MMIKDIFLKIECPVCGKEIQAYLNQQEEIVISLKDFLNLIFDCGYCGKRNEIQTIIKKWK